MRGANWRDATRRTNLDYLTSHVYPTLEHVPLKDISKFEVQMLLNRLAAEGYSYTVVYHVRDLIKAGSAEAVDQEVLDRNVARKTVIPEIEESEKPVLPVEMYAKLLQRKKIKRKNRYGRTNYRLVAIPQAVRHAIDLWRTQCPNSDASALMFPGMQARARKPLATPIHPDNWLRLRLYPVAKKLEIAFHPTFQVLRRSFSTHGKKEAHPTEMQANSDTATFAPLWTPIRRFRTRK
jgi:hypothetical protein